MSDSVFHNLLTAFYAAASLQGYFLSGVLFFTRKGNRNANRILALLMLLFSYYLTDIYMGRSGWFDQFPHILHISTPLWYLFPPLSYIYVRLLMDKPIHWRFLHLLHLIPFLIIVYRLYPFYFLPGEIKLQFFNGEIQPPGGLSYRFFLAMINPVQGILYFSYIIYLIKPQIASPDQQRAANPASGAHFTWLKLFFSFMAVYSCSMAVFISYYFYTGEFLLPIKHLPLAIFSLLLYSVAYLAIARPSTLFPSMLLSPKRGNGAMPEAAQAKRKAAELLRLMQVEKLYLNSELKYSDLAARLGISVRQFSEILNREIGQSFNDFVNAYRVREVQQRLQNPENGMHTLLSIALDAGFSNKASFNRIFKKHSGITPSEYLNRCRSQAATS